MRRAPRRSTALAVVLSSAVAALLLVGGGGPAGASTPVKTAGCAPGPIAVGAVHRSPQIDESGSGYVEQVGGRCFDWWYTTDRNRKKPKSYAVEKKINALFCSRLAFQTQLNRVLGHGQLKTNDFTVFPITNTAKHPVARCGFNNHWIGLSGSLLPVENLYTVDVDLARSSDPELLGHTLTSINSELNYTFTPIRGVGAAAFSYTTNRPSAFSGVIATDGRGTLVDVTVDKASLKGSIRAFARQALAAGRSYR